MRPNLRAVMDVVWGRRGCAGLRAGPTVPLGLSGWLLPAFYTPAGARGASTPFLASSHTFSRGDRGNETETGTAIAVSQSCLDDLCTALKVSLVSRPSQSPRTTQREADVPVSGLPHVVPSLVNISPGCYSGLARASHHGASFQNSFLLRGVLRSRMCHERARCRMTA